MVYVASLGLQAKKALGSKCYQSSLQNIINTLPIDPQVSNMDVVLLGPQDIAGQFGKQVIEAVGKRHESICVIYMCTSDKELALFSNAPHTKLVKRIRDTTITEVISEFYGHDVMAVDRKYTSSSDRVVELGTNVETPKVVVQAVEPEPEPEPEPIPIPDTWLEESLQKETVEIPETQQPVPTPNTAEDLIDSVKSVADWDILKKQIDRDGIIRQLIMENNEFAGVVNMLDVWDLKIRDIWADSRKSNAEKMAAVQEFGTNRQVLQATYNSVLVDKFVSLVERIVSVCTTTVEERLDEITHNVISLQTDKEAFIECAVTGEGDLADKLYEQTMELKMIEGELCNMFSLMHKEGMEEILSRLNEKLPSTNEFINNVLSVSAKLYTPANTVNLGETIIEALSKGQIQLSMVADKIVSLMENLFKVIEAQHEVITYQRNVINCLRANHVESLVVRDSLLKNCFHVMVGSENTGLTSTVSTYAGMLSRRQNTLVVDLTGHPHYDRYGYEVTPLVEFMVERVQKPLLFVAGEVADPEQLFLLMEELKNRISYFHNLILVLDAKQMDVLDQVGREALSISYVTNCTVESLDHIKKAYGGARTIPNVCHKLVCIDNPVDVSSLVTSLQMDISMTQLIPIPYLKEMRKAAVVGQQPHTYTDVLRIFEEAFRV